MYILKKIVSFIVTIMVLSMVLLIPTYAKDAPSPITNKDLITTQKVNKIISEGKRIKKQDVPKTVTPLEFNNENEVREYFKNVLNSMNNNAQPDVKLSAINSYSLLSTSKLAATSSGKNISESYTAKYTLGLCKLIVKTNYTYYKPTGRAGTLKSANPSVYLSGITFGNTLDDVSCYSEIISSNTIHTVANGSIAHYIFIEGVGTIYKTPFSKEYTKRVIS